MVGDNERERRGLPKSCVSSFYGRTRGGLNIYTYSFFILFIYLFWKMTCSRVGLNSDAYIGFVFFVGPQRAQSHALLNSRELLLITY